MKKFILLLLALLIIGALAGCNLDANVGISPGAADTTDDYENNVNPNVGDIDFNDGIKGPANRMGTER